MPVGRPTKYTPEMLEKAKDYFTRWEPYYETPVDKQAKDGSITTTMKRCANGAPNPGRLADHLGINRSTVYAWQDQYPEFSNIIKRGIKECFTIGMHENGLTGEWSTAMTIWLSKQYLGMKDKSEVDTNIKLKLDNIKIEMVDAQKRVDTPDTQEVRVSAEPTK